MNIPLRFLRAANKLNYNLKLMAEISNEIYSCFLLNIKIFTKGVSNAKTILYDAAEDSEVGRYKFRILIIERTRSLCHYRKTLRLLKEFVSLI